MIKIMILVKRRSDVSPESFSRHWTTHHAELIGRLPGLDRHTQNHVIHRPGHPPLPFDGVAVSWLANQAALDELLASQAYRDMVADEPNFIDPAATVILPVHEVETELDLTSTDPDTLDTRRPEPSDAPGAATPDEPG